MSEFISSDVQQFDGAQIVADLNRLLHLRTTVIGMKLFDAKQEMEAVPRIRRPNDIDTTDQIVGQAAQWLDGEDNCR